MLRKDCKKKYVIALLPGRRILTYITVRHAPLSYICSQQAAFGENYEWRVNVGTNISLSPISTVGKRGAESGISLLDNAPQLPGLVRYPKGILIIIFHAIETTTDVIFQPITLNSDKYRKLFFLNGMEQFLHIFTKYIMYLATLFKKSKQKYNCN